MTWEGADMKVQLSKNEIIDLIKSVPLAYCRYKPELEMAGGR